MSLLKQKENVVTWVTLPMRRDRENKRQLVLGKIGASAGSPAVRLLGLSNFKEGSLPQLIRQ